MFLQPINIKNAPTSKSAEAKMIAGVIREDPIIPAIDNPVNIKAPEKDRNSYYETNDSNYCTHL
jgi:hypothetical protein